MTQPIFEQSENFVFTHAQGRVLDRAQRVIDGRPPTARIAVIPIAAGHDPIEALTTRPNLEELLTGDTREAWTRKELGPTEISIVPDRWERTVRFGVNDLTWDADAQTPETVSLIVVAYCPGGVGRDHDHYALPLTGHAFHVTPEHRSSVTAALAGEIFRGIDPALRRPGQSASRQIARLMRGYR